MPKFSVPSKDTPYFEWVDMTDGWYNVIVWQDYNTVKDVYVFERGSEAFNAWVDFLSGCSVFERREFLR